MTTTLPTPEPASAPWSEYLARQRAERAADAQQAAAKARAAVLAVRRRIAAIVLSVTPIPLTVHDIVHRLGLDVAAVPTVAVHLAALAEQGHLIELADGHAGGGWSLAPGFLDRVTQRGIEQEVSRVESGRTGVDGVEG